VIVVAGGIAVVIGSSNVNTVSNIDPRGRWFGGQFGHSAGTVESGHPATLLYVRVFRFERARIIRHGSRSDAQTVGAFRGQAVG